MVYGARGFADEEVEFAKGRVALGKRIGDVSRWIKGCKDVYISVDVDVFDPSLAPGVGNPEPLGISFDEFLKAVAEAIFKVPLKGMDVVEVSPPYDPSGITAVLATKVVVETTAMHYVTWEKRKLTS
jgi:agmatinase